MRGEERSVDRDRLTPPRADSGPPWILGLRGSPHEAPENTLASLRRALELGLDGLAYDVRACATGELLLLRDETLDRATDGRGRLAEKRFPEVSTLDAGSSFRASFRGERLATLAEALALGGPRVRYLAWLQEPGLVPEVVRLVRRLGQSPQVLVASRSREVCLEARDAGLHPMLVLPRATEEARAFVRDERIRACGAESGGFPPGEWPSERWAIGADAPAELLDACRAPIDGLATREPLRALAVKSLVALAPGWRGPHPVTVPDLEVPREVVASGQGEGRGECHGECHGEWWGSWTCTASVANPFPFAVEATAGVVPRRGAFETEGLPAKLELAEGSEQTLAFRITGGSWRVGGDPTLFALYRWARGSGRRAGSLLLDAPLVRIRVAVAEPLPVRLPLLRESPADLPASMVLRRRGAQLFVAIENAGGLGSPRAIVHLDGRLVRGGRGVRAALPADFDARRGGVAFSCGIEGLAGEERVVRRWAGGVPDEDDAGAPGRLLPRATA